MAEPSTVARPYAEAAFKLKPSVIWLHFQECTGCTESLLRTSHPALSNLIARRLDQLRRFRVITPRAAAALSAVDARSFKAGMLYVNRSGLFRVRS